MGAIPSGKGGERFPQLPPKGRIWGIWGVGRPAATTYCCSGRGGVRERKGGWGRRGRRGPRILALSRQPAWRDRLVAAVHVARQRGPRHRRRGAALARAASVATLSGRQGICRASGVGATSPLCRAIVCPSPVRTAFFTWWRGSSLWSCHSQWRDRVALSRHP